MEPKDPKTYLWQRICDLMGQESPSIAAVAKRIGVGNGTAQRIKEAQTSVGVDVLMAAARAFNLEVSQLLEPPGQARMPLDWYSLAIQEAMDHDNALEREMLLLFVETVRRKLDRASQAIAERAKQHTPERVRG